VPASARALLRASRTLGALGLALLVLAASGRAHAIDVAIDARGCEPALVDRVRAALLVELTAVDEGTLALLRAGALRISIECGASEGVLVAVEHPTTGRTGVERIGETGPGLERRVALAITELASSVAPEPPRREEAPPAPSPSASPGPRPASLWLRVSGGASIGGEPWALLGTAEIGLEMILDPAVVLAIGLAGVFGSWSVDAGVLRMGALSLATSLRFGGAIGDVQLHAGPAARGGPVLWSGSPRDATIAAGRDGVGAWLGLGVAARCGVALGGGWRLEIDLEGGGIAVSSAANVFGAPGARMSSGWIEAKLGVAVALD
jgi:hypothetical protein